MEKQVTSIKNTSNVIMGANTAINVVLSSSLALLWGLINTLQIIAYFKWFAVVLP